MNRLPAFAKINLTLHVLGRRADGFHELQTVFERISLADTLTFEPHPRLQLSCDRPGLPCGEDNLVIKAARLLQKLSGSTQGADIRLEKRIPVAAGLGGGSSDAATTLVGLNQLWQLGLNQQTLVEASKQLGSDVTFFLHDTPFAVGRGRGERCEAVACQAVLAHVLVVPDAQLSTAEVFGGLHLDLTAKKPPINIIEHALCNGSLGELASGLWNDLSAEAIRRCPVIGKIQSSLMKLGCLGCSLSGSGPSVFGLCQDAAHAQSVTGRLRESAPASWRIEAVQTAR